MDRRRAGVRNADRQITAPDNLCNDMFWSRRSLPLSPPEPPLSPFALRSPCASSGFRACSIYTKGRPRWPPTRRALSTPTPPARRVRVLRWVTNTSGARGRALRKGKS